MSNVGTCSFSRVALGWRNRFCAERLRWPIDRAGRDALQDRQRPVFPEGDKLPRRHARVGILSLPSRHFFYLIVHLRCCFIPSPPSPSWQTTRRPVTTLRLSGRNAQTSLGSCLRKSGLIADDPTSSADDDAQTA